MSKLYPKEFRDDVVAVTRQGQAPLKQIAKDFVISEGFLSNWMKKADGCVEVIANTAPSGSCR